jgi:hypothetical protein
VLSYNIFSNLRKRASASVMIEISRVELNLKGVLIRGRVELIYGEEALRINRLIHLKYVMPEALNDVKAHEKCALDALICLKGRL